MSTALAIPREDLDVEIDVLVAIARCNGWHDRLPEVVTAAYDPAARMLGRALLGLANDCALTTAWDIRVGDMSVELSDATGRPDAGVVLTVPGLRAALVDAGADNPDRLVSMFEAALNDAPLIVESAIEHLTELARDRDLMSASRDLYNGLAQNDGSVWRPALDHILDLAAGIAA